jgi:hypothetical protein
MERKTQSSEANAKLGILPNLTELERFVAALKPCHPACGDSSSTRTQTPYRQLESAQDRLERVQRASFGGWPGG